MTVYLKKDQPCCVVLDKAVSLEKSRRGQSHRNAMTERGEGVSLKKRCAIYPGH